MAYYLLNANTRQSQKDHEDMILNGKASAKTEIDQLLKGEIVFLYKNEVGIVAIGEASKKIDSFTKQGFAEFTHRD